MQNNDYGDVTEIVITIIFNVILGLIFSKFWLAMFSLFIVSNYQYSRNVLSIQQIRHSEPSIQLNHPNSILRISWPFSEATEKMKC
jgi:hypothetical protein